MLTEMEDILTLPNDFVAQTGGRITATLPVLLEEDLLGLTEEFALGMPLAEARSANYRNLAFQTSQNQVSAYADAEEYIGELVEFPVAAPPPATVATALVPSRFNVPTEQLAPRAKAPAVEPEKHVVFALAGVKFGVPMAQVIEVRELEHFTPVINVPRWVIGVTNLRGDIVSVVDLLKILNPAVPRGPRAQPFRNLIVAQTRQGDLTACLAVEMILGLAQAPTTEIQKVDRLVGDGLTPYTRGIFTQGEDLLSILDLESLLRALEITS